MRCLPRLTSPALALLLAAGTLSADEPRPFPQSLQRQAENPNQMLANAVAGELRASGVLRNFRIDVICKDGTAELVGSVGDSHQRDEAARLAQGVPGVARVLNRLMSRDSTTVRRTQFENGLDGAIGQVQPEKAPVELVPAPRPTDVHPQDNEPVPSFRAPIPPPTGSSLPPPMPPFAWPSYAPYNNYSRVAYPVAYPDCAFPLIGPVYPFPKVPLTWRKVTLEYDDGHWWLMTHGQKKDWWTLRYW